MKKRRTRADAQVAVREAVRVDVGQRGEDLREVEARDGRREALVPPQLGEELAARDELHDEIHLFFVLERAEERHDEGVAEPREDGALVLDVALVVVLGDVALGHGLERDELAVLPELGERDLRSNRSYSIVSTQLVLISVENSTRAVDPCKNQPNRLRFDRAREV